MQCNIYKTKCCFQYHKWKRPLQRTLVHAIGNISYNTCVALNHTICTKNVQLRSAIKKLKIMINRPKRVMKSGCSQIFTPKPEISTTVVSQLVSMWHPISFEF